MKEEDILKPVATKRKKSARRIKVAKNLPRSTIRSYPVEYTKKWKVDSQRVTIRPIRPEDEPLMVEFHKTLSDRSVYFRYFGTLSLQQRTGHERLRRVCCIDYDREMVLVVDHTDRSRGHHIVGVGRLVKEPGTDEAEFAILVSDSWQGKGLGAELLGLLVQVGRKEKVRRIFGHIVTENTAMRRVSEEVGFNLRFDEDEGEWKAEILL